MTDQPAYTYRANLTRIIDGDTFDLDIDLGLDVWKRHERVRLYGIDAPERYTDPGKAAIRFLQEIFPEAALNDVIVTTRKSAAGEQREKYGRYLARITVLYGSFAGQDLTEIMLAHNHGTPYFGGPR